MDFGGLPPEINSERMYSGTGPGSMLAAAAAVMGWLATPLMAAGYLGHPRSDGWQGPRQAGPGAPGRVDEHHRLYARYSRCDASMTAAQCSPGIGFAATSSQQDDR